MGKTTKILSTIAVCLTLMFASSMSTKSATVNLLPFEDKDLGRNSNAYLSIYGTLATQEKKAFIDDISKYAKRASEQWGIPASAIIGMAAIESGYGTTRIAIHANNLFGIKVWGYDPANAWQLKGQPSEDYEPIPVLAEYGVNRIVFDESQRRDNWYRMFSSYEDAVNYLAGKLLQNQRYAFARDRYENRMQDGWSVDQASKQYLFEIADAGYNHLGGSYYRNVVGNVMDAWNLYEYDRNGFIDTYGHWAEKEILYLAENGWVNGYPDGTFKPNNKLTRAQAATIMTNFLELPPTNDAFRFDDVPVDFWAINPITLVAEHGIMNGIGDGRFSPNTNMTRAQMATIFYNAGFYKQVATTESSPFKDVTKDHWAYEAIETMRQEGIMGGYTDGNFGPNDPITRAQMAAVIHRVSQLDYTYTK